MVELMRCFNAHVGILNRAADASNLKVDLPVGSHAATRSNALYPLFRQCTEICCLAG